MQFPVVFQLGSLAIPAHFLFETLAYTLGFQIYRYRLKQQSSDTVLPAEQRLYLLVACVIGAVILAKGLGWLQTPYVLNTQGLKEWVPPGKTIVGGLLGGWIGIEWAKWKLKIQTKTGDLYLWPLAIGLMLGRMGCFLSGLHDNTHGLPSNLPWAVNLGDGILRHPTQLYEIMFVLGATFLLTRSAFDRFTVGSRFRLWMAGYLGFRFLSEWIKPVMYIYGGLSAIQWACALGIAWSLMSFWQLNKPGQVALESTHKLSIK